MAKKKAATTKLNMSEEIKILLGANSKVSAKEALEAIKAKYPAAQINEKSFGVGFYIARKKLGIASKSHRGAAKKVVMRKMPSATRPSVDMATLQAAVKYLNEVGSAERAVEAIKQIQALQMTKTVPF
jgi:hypothetical protein